MLLRWSKLLKCDFFRVYSQHFILYSPQKSSIGNVIKESALPVLIKNVYTLEVIEYLVELVNSGKKQEVSSKRNTIFLKQLFWVGRINTKTDEQMQQTILSEVLC